MIVTTVISTRIDLSTVHLFLGSLLCLDNADSSDVDYFGRCNLILIGLFTSQDPLCCLENPLACLSSLRLPPRPMMAISGCLRHSCPLAVLIISHQAFVHEMLFQIAAVAP